MIDDDIIKNWFSEIVFGPEENGLYLLFKELGERISSFYLEKKEKGRIKLYDYGESRLFKILYHLCKFVDTTGKLFYDNFDAILPENKEYNLVNLSKDIIYWNDKHNGDAIIAIVRIFEVLGFIKKCTECGKIYTELTTQKCNTPRCYDDLVVLEPNKVKSDNFSV